MRTIDTPGKWARLGTRQAFTLAEVVVAMAIVATVLAGMTVAYTQAARRAQWSGFSLAAQALGVQTLERARSAVWDVSISKNQITNLNLSNWSYSGGVVTGYTWTNLDLPVSGTNFVPATNYVSISMLYLNGATNPPVQVQLIKVQTVWGFPWGSTNFLYTNTIATYCGPDNRSDSSL